MEFEDIQKKWLSFGHKGKRASRVKIKSIIFIIILHNGGITIEEILKLFNDLRKVKEYDGFFSENQLRDKDLISEIVTEMVQERWLREYHLKKGKIKKKNPIQTERINEYISKLKQGNKDFFHLKTKELLIYQKSLKKDKRKTIYDFNYNNLFHFFTYHIRSGFLSYSAEEISNGIKFIRKYCSIQLMTTRIDKRCNEQNSNYEADGDSLCQRTDDSFGQSDDELRNIILLSNMHLKSVARSNVIDYCTIITYMYDILTSINNYVTICKLLKKKAVKNKVIIIPNKGYTIKSILRLNYIRPWIKKLNSNNNDQTHHLVQGTIYNKSFLEYQKNNMLKGIVREDANLKELVKDYNRKRVSTLLNVVKDVGYILFKNKEQIK